MGDGHAVLLRAVKVVLDHIIRESEYFVGIAQALLAENRAQLS
jgi:hypothetical protein